MNLFLDIETRSTIDLNKAGAYVYAAHPSTEILMAAWAVDNDPVDVWICRDGPMPYDLAEALMDPDARLIAHNASFERTLLASQAGRAVGFPDVGDVSYWDCTAASAACLGLPRSLEGAASALGLPVEKDKDGRALMLRMCKPQKLRKRDEPGTIRWVDDRASTERLAQYCMHDVVVERAIYGQIPVLSGVEREIWEETERLNDRGIAVDDELLVRVLDLIDRATEDLDRTISAKTGGAVPKLSNHMALTAWLNTQGIDDEPVTSVAKAAVAAMLENPDLDPVIRSVLALRRDGGGSSPKKWASILKRISTDGRVRGAMVYSGAASTRRWSSRGVQLQNLPRGGSVKKPLHAVRDILDGADVEYVHEAHGPPLIVAGEILRPAFIARPGMWLARGDSSQIEARVNPWLAGAEHTLAAFRAFDGGTGPDLYRVAAAAIYGIPIADVTSAQRQIGKVAVLALGFQGGQAAFRSMAKAYGVQVTAAAAEEIKIAWRAANPEIVAMWGALNDTALRCLSTSPGTVCTVPGTRGLSFKRNRMAMAMRLPSGGSLIYWNATLRDVQTPWGMRPACVYRAAGTLTNRWDEFTAYGGLLCENAVQATARDAAADWLLQCPAEGLSPVLLVHDEIVCETSRERYPNAKEAARVIGDIMRRVPAWAAGLPLAAESSAGPRYIKA